MSFIKTIIILSKDNYYIRVINNYIIRLLSHPKYTKWNIMFTNPKYGPNIIGPPNMSITKVRTERKLRKSWQVPRMEDLQQASI